MSSLSFLFLRLQQGEKKRKEIIGKGTSSLKEATLGATIVAALPITLGLFVGKRGIAPFCRIRQSPRHPRHSLGWSRMRSQLRIVHPPSSDNPTDLSVLLLSVDSNQDAQKYIFNLPEGTTRTLIQQGFKGKSGLRNVFLPRVGSQECGGLAGESVERKQI